MKLKCKISISVINRFKVIIMNASLELLASMLPEGADAALIASQTNRRYFTGFSSDLGYLLLTRKKSYLLVDSRYSEAAQAEARGVQVITFKKLSESLHALVEKHSLGCIALEGSGFNLNEARSMETMLSPAELIETAAVDEAIGKLRIVKTSYEVEKIMKAQRITEQALTETLPLVKPGVMERDIALELEYRIKKLGAQDVSFDLIVISGRKTSMPHGVPSENLIRSGDFITFDIGALYEGYHSDMTRTYAVGEISDKQRRIYSVVKDAQRLGLEAVRSGVAAGDVDKAAREYITHAGFGEYFGHSTGHGVGLDIHELPSVSSGNDSVLQSGSVITVEPGIYLPGEFGVRIEDTVVVTPEGHINLCALPKDLISIG